jgi:hypothetical protein
MFPTESFVRARLLVDGDTIAIRCFESFSGEGFLVKPMNLHFSMYGSDIQPGISSGQIDSPTGLLEHLN